MNSSQKETSFEQSYRRLEEILFKLENELDNSSLEDIIKYYEEGLQLLKVCRTKLTEAELKIQKISTEHDN